MSGLGFVRTSSGPARNVSHRLKELANEISGLAEEEAKTSSRPAVILPFGHAHRIQLVELARETRRSRRLRGQFLRKDYFGEVPWEILLYLYVEEDMRRISIGAVAVNTGAPLTTALRWLCDLEKEGRVVTAPDPADGRARLIRLTDKCRQEMDNLFREVLRNRM